MAKRIRTINTESLQKTAKTGGCGECQTSCQSACKTSCTVGNQVLQTKNNKEARLAGLFLFMCIIHTLYGISL